LVFLLIGAVFPLDNSFTALISPDSNLFGRVEYWLADDLDPAGLVFKWIPVFFASFIVSKSLLLFYKTDAHVLHKILCGFEARVVWLLFLFTAIGFWGRYLNAFSMRFGLWAIIFGSIPIFLLRSTNAKFIFVFFSVVLYLATVTNLYINKVPADFEYIYRYVFFPASAF